MGSVLSLGHYPLMSDEHLPDWKDLTEFKSYQGENERRVIDWWSKLAAALVGIVVSRPPKGRRQMSRDATVSSLSKTGDNARSIPGLARSLQNIPSGEIERRYSGNRKILRLQAGSGLRIYVYA